MRASTTLTGSTCGTTYSGYTLVATNPTTPYSDTVPARGCYKYQLLVTDHVGNLRTNTGANVTKVNI